MKIDHNKIQFGSDPDPTKNFIIQTPPVQDGTLEIRRGTLEAPGALVATFDENGLVDPRTFVNVTGQRVLNQYYTNNTSAPLVVYFNAVATTADGHAMGFIGGAIVQTSWRAGSQDWDCSVSYTVPPGATYRIHTVNATTKSWLEYRIPEGT